MGRATLGQLYPFGYNHRWKTVMKDSTKLHTVTTPAVL